METSRPAAVKLIMWQIMEWHRSCGVFFSLSKAERTVDHYQSANQYLILFAIFLQVSRHCSLPVRNFCESDEIIPRADF